MKRILLSILTAIMAVNALAAELPKNIYVSDTNGHVQGIAIDREKGYIYLSFTTKFIKADLKGNVIGSIDRVQGHLGAMTLGPDGKVYASLECKDDAIGKGIAKHLGTDVLDHSKCVFYVAVIDVDKIDRPDIDPEKGDVMTTVCIKEAGREYQSGKYGCSGIDGITFAPAFGKKGGKMFLYVAYGIYKDLERKDNDHQILLCYDTKNWKKYETPVVFGEVPTNGPEKPLKKYFVYTGNTSWGVQNMAFDKNTGRIFMAVYKGSKPEFPNYDLFAVDVAQKPVKAILKGVDEKALTLKLSDDGLKDEATGVRGWRFKWGSTGLCPLGDGQWYISENGKNKETKIQYCNARLYNWTGDAEQPFKKAE